MSIVERAVERMGGTPGGPSGPKRMPVDPRGGADASGERDVVHRLGSRPAQAVEPPSPDVDPRPELLIDSRWLRAQKFITPDSGRTRMAEDFRRIKRHLLTGAARQRVMVTSALPGEGKTFCAINLAISLAMELNRSVVLVDADTVRPSVLRSMGVDDDLPGLMDALVDGDAAAGEGMIRRTQIGRLGILPPGTHRANATELLASDTMRALVESLSARHPDRIVIFDSPPLLVASESAALAAHMSQILMVVAAKQTTEVALREALKRLEECNCPVGLLLNKSESEGLGYGYYGLGQEYQAYERNPANQRNQGITGGHAS